MSKTSLTAAGQIRPQSNSDDLIETINQIFTLFRINFHNQYYKAYPEVELLNQAKKLWLESLRHYNPHTLLSATKRIIEEQEYLPTLNQMLTFCAQDDSAAPSAHQAYVEACNAPSPKASHKWSHPAVFEAGKRSDWFFLATTPQQFALPVFRGNYEAVLIELGQGKEVDLPALEAQKSNAEEKPLQAAEGLSKVKEIRNILSKG